MKLPILNLESRIPGYSSDDSISPEFKAYINFNLEKRKNKEFNDSNK